MSNCFNVRPGSNVDIFISDIASREVVNKTLGAKCQDASMQVVSAGADPQHKAGSSVAIAGPSSQPIDGPSRGAVARSSQAPNKPVRSKKKPSSMDQKVLAPWIAEYLVDMLGTQIVISYMRLIST